MSTQVNLAKADGTVLWSTHAAEKPDATAGSDARARKLSEPETAAVLVVSLAVAVLGVIGLANSFAAVAEHARPDFGPMAWTVPLAIDLGIAVFSALDLVMSRLDMRLPWLRLIPWSLTGVTIWLNVAGETTWFGRIAHAVLPGLWVVAVEVGTHAVRTRAGLASGRRMDSIRLARWLLAFGSTAGLWRRMVLWEIRSYPDALRRERDRVLAKTRLQDAYGLLWRWKAPRRERALYRLGELAPEALAAQVAAPAMAELPAAPAKRTSEPRKRATSRKSARKTVRRAKAPAPDVSDLIPAAEAAATAIAERGESVTARTLAGQLRAAGRQVGNGKLTALLDHLRSQGDETGGQAA